MQQVNNMKKLITILLVLASTLGVAQVKPAATYTNIDSTINAHLDITGALNATNNFAYYLVTQGQIQAIINNIKTSVSSQLEALTFGNPPKPTSGYKASVPVNLKGVNNITISGDSITAGGVPGFTLTNCYNIHIHGNKVVNGKGNNSVAVYLVNCHDITIDSCYFSSVTSGVYAVDCTTNIVVTNNYMLNMVGPYPRGQFVQFNGVSGSGNIISYNKCKNIMGQSTPEDAINMFVSSGTVASPIQILGNWIQGGGPSKTGGGIMTGDSGGSYVIVSGNILVDPGQYGIANSGGSNISIVNNEIYARSQSFTNVGLYVASEGGAKAGATTVSGNKVTFYSSSGGLNSDWIGTGSQAPTVTPIGWSNNNWNAGLTAAILPAF